MLSRDNTDRIHDSLGLQAAHDQGTLVHPFRPFMGIADSDGRQVEQRGFLCDGSAVRQDTKSRHLQLDVIEQAKGFHEPNERMVERLPKCLQAFTGARMRGYDNRELVSVGQSPEGLEKIP
ncbi:hypothetical protein D3C76_1429410 [compost metagenome]